MIPPNPTVCICLAPPPPPSTYTYTHAQAVGFHYAKSTIHAVEMKLKLETDTADMLNEIIYCCRQEGLRRHMLHRAACTAAGIV